MVAPENAKKAIVTLSKTTEHSNWDWNYDTSYIYFSTINSSNAEEQTGSQTYIDQEVLIPEEQIQKTPVEETLNTFTFWTRDSLDFAQHRRATINFQFDDNHPKDDDLVEVFKEYNYRCGFALIYSSPTVARFPINL